MTQWYTIDGEPVRDRILNPDFNRGIAHTRTTETCRNCGGRRQVRGEVCPQCCGGGMMTRLRMAYTKKAMMEAKARMVRIRLHRQSRNAERVRQRMANFESENAEVLRMLRNYQSAIPAFRRMLQDAEHSRMITDDMESTVYRMYNEHCEYLRRMEQAQEEATRSEHLGEQGERIEFTATIQSILHRPCSQVGVRLVTDSGHQLSYGGRARNMYSLRRGDRVTMAANVRAHRVEPYRNQEGERFRGVVANTTIINRPRRVRVHGGDDE